MATGTNNLDLALRINADLHRAQEQLRAAQRDVLEFGTAGDQAGKKLQGMNRRIDRSEQRLDRFRRGVGGVRTALGALAGAAAFGAVARGAARVTRELEQTQRSALSLGESVEEVQELNFVFRQFGLQGDDVNDVLNTLADRALDAQQGAKGMIEDFGAAGITVDDLRNKDPVELFELMVDRISGIDEVSRRSGVAVRLLGDELGRRLLPLLVQGAGEVDEIRQQLRDMNGVLGKDSVEATAEANRQFRLLRETVDAQFARAVADNVDEFTELADVLNDPDILQGIQAVVGGMSTMAGWLVQVTSQLGEVGTAMGETFGEMAAGPVDAIERLDEQIAKVERRLEGVGGTASETLGALGGAAASSGDTLEDPDLAGQAELLDELEALQKQRQQLVAEAAARAQEQVNVAGPASFPSAIPDDDDTEDPEPEPDAGSPGQGDGTGADRQEKIDQIIGKLREQKATTGEAAVATEVYELKQLDAKKSTVELAQELIDAAEAQERDAESKEDAAEATDKARQSNQELIASLKEERELLQLEQDQGARAAFIERTARRLERSGGVDVPEERIRSLAGSVYDLRQESEDTAEGMSEFFAEAAREIQSSLADFLVSPMEQGFDGLASSFADMLVRIQAEAAAAQITDALFGRQFGETGELGGLLQSGASAVSGYFGGGFNAGSSSAAAAGIPDLLPTSVFHAGGIAGGPAPQRALPAAAFADAIRMHSGGMAGLRHDEVPTILQRGEEVLTASDPRHRGNISEDGRQVPPLTVEIHGVEGDKQVESTRQQTQPDGTELYQIWLGEWRRDLARNGEATRAMTGTFPSLRRGGRSG